MVHYSIRAIYVFLQNKNKQLQQPPLDGGGAVNNKQMFRARFIRLFTW
jgi:hypothetical protein